MFNRNMDFKRRHLSQFLSGISMCILININILPRYIHTYLSECLSTFLAKKIIYTHIIYIVVVYMVNYIFRLRMFCTSLKLKNGHEELLRESVVSDTEIAC